MTEKEKIIKLYKKKTEQFLKYNKAYFLKDNPIISDSQFDELKNELLGLAKKYSYLKKIKNLENMVGSKPSAILHIILSQNCNSSSSI